MVDPGQGERRAATGYYPQYRVAAELTLTHIRDLEWLKVADPAAGMADDFQLATRSGIVHALQVKWSGFASAFTFRELTIGDPSLAEGLAEAWKRLRAANPGRAVQIHLVSNNYPSTNDSVRAPVPNAANHFAAFVARGLTPVQRALRHRDRSDVRLKPYIGDWKEAWDSLRAASGLAEETFWEFVSDLHLNLGVGAEAFPELGRVTPARRRDLDELAEFLFGQVADPAHIVRITHAELLDRLGWTRRLSYRSQHVFPVPTAYQPNEDAVVGLMNAIETHPGGYLALAAPAGAGKSSLLTATPLTAKRVVYYYAYTPAAPDPSTGRGESENFFFDLVTALDAAGLHTGDVVDPRDRLANKDRLLRQIELANREWLDTGSRTILVVDGLDHIPREQRPARSLIDDLPHPSQVPDGVFVILGTQLLDILPVAVRTALQETNRVLAVPPLSDATVLAIAVAAGPGQWLQPEQKQRLIAAAEGHPLALTYLLEELSDISFDADAPTPAWSVADSVLEQGATYRGSVLERYEGYWQLIESASEVHQLLAIVARIRSSVHLEWLRTWNTQQSVSSFANTAAPFFIKDGSSWTFIHNSFRQFLIQRTATVGGVFDRDEHRRLHAEAADICASASGPWASYRDEELAQRVHAEQHHEVLALATPERLRERLLDLAPPAAIRLDADLALRSAAALHDASAVLRLALMQFELELRGSVLEPHDLAFALIDIGEYEAALPHVIGGRELRLDSSRSLQAAARLLAAERIADAGGVIRAVGSLRALLETSRQGSFYDRDTAERIQWWVAVHARIRPAEDVLGDIEVALPSSSPSSGDEEDNEKGPLADYRQAALIQLAAELSEIETPRFVVSKLAEVDPAAAANAELRLQPGASAEDTTSRIDTALGHLGVVPSPESPYRWSPKALESVPLRLRVKAAELLIRSSGLSTSARGLVEGAKLPPSDSLARDQQADIWLGYKLQRLQFLLGIHVAPTDAIRKDSEDVGLELFRAALTELAELDASVLAIAT